MEFISGRYLNLRRYRPTLRIAMKFGPNMPLGKRKMHAKFGHDSPLRGIKVPLGPNFGTGCLRPNVLRIWFIFGRYLPLDICNPTQRGPTILQRGVMGSSKFWLYEKV